MVGKLDDYLRFQESALSLRGQRQQLLASNIANADTPNYKARDFDFNAALQGALHANDGTAGREAAMGQMAKTSAAHLDGNANATSAQASGPSGAPLLYRTEKQGSVDGNTVDLDAERNQFADNAVRYEAGLTMISAQIKSMLAAIQG